MASRFCRHAIPLLADGIAEPPDHAFAAPECGFVDSTRQLSAYKYFFSRPGHRYVLLVGDWDDFFQIQEELLLNVMNIVKQEGAAIAFPSQTMYFAAHSSDILAHLSPEFARRDESETLRDEAGVHH